MRIWHCLFVNWPDETKNTFCKGYSKPSLALQNQQLIEYKYGFPAFITSNHPTSNAKNTP